MICDFCKDTGHDPRNESNCPMCFVHHSRISRKSPFDLTDEEIKYMWPFLVLPNDRTAREARLKGCRYENGICRTYHTISFEWVDETTTKRVIRWDDTGETEDMLCDEGEAITLEDVQSLL